MNLSDIIKESISDMQTYVVSNFTYGYKKRTQASSKEKAKNNVAYTFAKEYAGKLGIPEPVLRAKFFQGAVSKLDSFNE